MHDQKLNLLNEGLQDFTLEELDGVSGGAPKWLKKVGRAVGFISAPLESTVGELIVDIARGDVKGVEIGSSGVQPVC